MSVYIYKNNQQFGPFEDSQILQWLASGQLAPEDMAVRLGEGRWQALSHLFPNAARRTPSVAPPISAAAKVAAPVSTGFPPKRKGAGKILFLSLGLVALLVVGTIGIAAFVLVGNQKTKNVSTKLSNPGNTNMTAENSAGSNSVNKDTKTDVPNSAELTVRLKEFAKLNPPAKLEKNPVLKGKVIVVEHRDRDNEYSLEMISGTKLDTYGLTFDRTATGPADLETLVQISCGKGKMIGKYGPRMAYVPAYSNVCNVAVIDYRAAKTIAKKSFVNGKRPEKIYVSDSEIEYVLAPPLEEVKKYVSGLPKE